MLLNEKAMLPVVRGGGLSGLDALFGFGEGVKFVEGEGSLEEGLVLDEGASAHVD